MSLNLECKVVIIVFVYVCILNEAKVWINKQLILKYLFIWNNFRFIENFARIVQKFFYFLHPDSLGHVSK